MPIITAFPDTFRTYNRVEVNWSDVPAATQARVLRVNVDTGECVPLRPYVCFEGDYLDLSCGHAVFWDTEVPLDTSVYYITDSPQAPCIPADPLVSDGFSRVLVNSWGSTESGSLGPLAYTLDGGTNPGNYDVNGAEGTHTIDTTGAFRYSTVNIGSTNFDAYATTTTPVTATGAPITAAITGRYLDANNHYFGRIMFDTTGNVVFQITRIVAGVTAVITQVTDGPYSPGQPWRLRFRASGSTLQLKAWNASLSEPDTWNLTTVDTSLTTGTRVGMATRRDNLNTNGTIIMTWDDFLVVQACAPCVPVTAETPPSTMPSNGVFRLKDPVRPCHDQPVPLCFTQANNADIDGTFCVPGSGIFFASMSSEARASNSVLLGPVNAALPISVSRARRGVSSTLQVVTRTFDDRDAVLALNAPGSPLLLQGPTAYGIPQRYMAVSTVDVDRGLSDHRFQVRVIDMPHIEVSRPAGPMQGPCGSQMDNLCDIYDTWQELEDSGLSWEDLIRGRASTAGGPGTTTYRTWNDVNADFASWNAVNTGGRDWIELEQGL